jgi:glycerophosphoryl diester phosphodiesterase
VATEGLVGAAHGRNLKVHVWTVNDEAQMRELIRLGVDGIITDQPARLLDLRRQGLPRQY